MAGETEILKTNTLVLEIDPTSRGVLCYFLESFGCKVTPVTSIEAALLLDVKAFELAFISEGLWRTKNFLLSKELPARGLTCPVVLLSTSDEVSEEILGKGHVNRVMQLPISKQRLMLLMKEIFP